MLISDQHKLIFVHIQKNGGEPITDLFKYDRARPAAPSRWQRHFLLPL